VLLLIHTLYSTLQHALSLLSLLCLHWLSPGNGFQCCRSLSFWVQQLLSSLAGVYLATNSSTRSQSHVTANGQLASQSSCKAPSGALLLSGSCSFVDVGYPFWREDRSVIYHKLNPCLVGSSDIASVNNNKAIHFKCFPYFKLQWRCHAPNYYLKPTQCGT
jgi:hypothetical protein